MAKKLNTYVHAVERNDKGETTNSGVFGPDDDLPAWAEKAITNDDVWQKADADPAEPASPAGSGTISARGTRRTGDAAK